MNVQGDYNYGNYTNYQPTQQTPAATPTPANAGQQPTGRLINLSATQLNALGSLNSFLQLFERTFTDQTNLAARIAEHLESGESLEGVLGTGINVTPEQAYEMIGEDGFWGVERTAQRLFDMAYGLSGGDEDLMETMRGAVLDGFEAAERVWGSDLPQISQDTLSRTMELFDSWVAGE